MALYQSLTAQRRSSPPRPLSAGAVSLAVFAFSFTKNFVAASDKLEIGLLPATAQIVRARIVGENLGAINATVGLMSGEPGANDPTRTIGNEIYNAVSVNTAETDATLLNMLAIAPADTHRAIGLTLSGDVAAAANKRIRLLIEYVY